MRAHEAEVLPLDECFGRVLAESVVSGLNVPSYARAAMDGYAVSSTDLVTASSEEPVGLVPIGAVRPGDRVPPPLSKGACIRVATGAPVPEAMTPSISRVIKCAMRGSSTSRPQTRGSGFRSHSASAPATRFDSGCAVARSRSIV